MKQFKLFLTVFIFHFSLFTATAQSDTLLIVRTGGHKAQIRDIAVTKDGKTIVSAGVDKTILLWDAQSGEIIDEIYGQQQEGDEGMIYAMALSPDNRWLAVGGFFGNQEDLIKVGTIRLYDFPSRRLIALLKGHTDVLSDLSFSENSEYLVSGSADNSVKVWKMTETQNLTGFENLLGLKFEVQLVQPEREVFR